jgi:hypothetical protein
MTPLIIILMLFVALPLLITLQGYVLHVLWSWFMVSTFGLPELFISQAIGLMVVVNFASGRMGARTTKAEDDEWQGDLAKGIFNPLIALLIGWIITWFLP